jgi:hypothetical protein
MSPPALDGQPWHQLGPQGALCFGSLDFIITTEGELVRALAPQPPPATDLDVIVEALHELQLSTPEVHTP